MSEMKNVLDVINEVAEGNEPSLRAFALALDVPATRLYAVARKPIPGEVYDPDMKNWDELNKFFVNHITAETSTIESMEALVTLAIEKDKWLAENARVHVAAGNNTIEVDGGKMPKRKAAMFEMGGEKESLICLKHDAQVYKMVYQTLGYTAIRPVNADGSFAKEEFRVISNGTLNTKCVAPANMESAIADRFSGAYAEQTTESENANQTEAETADEQ